MPLFANATNFDFQILSLAIDLLIFAIVIQPATTVFVFQHRNATFQGSLLFYEGMQITGPPREAINVTT